MKPGMEVTDPSLSSDLNDVLSRFGTCTFKKKRRFSMWSEARYAPGGWNS